MMFAGLTSRWITPARWAVSIASAIGASRPATSRGLEPSPARQQVLQRRPLDVLHHEEVEADVEDADDRGVAQRAGRLGLAAEAAEVIGGRLVGQVLGLDRLDGDDPRQQRVPGPYTRPIAPSPIWQRTS